MKKHVKTYATISDGIALTCCIHTAFVYLFDNNDDKLGGSGLSGVIITIAFVFTVFNGALMAIAGFYLILKGVRQLGWTTIVVVLLFYITTLLIHIYGKLAA
ncbi:MAG TPA: hypothetical protein VGS79_29060 [Puia sp.]|nr:hypothetical protein [Puia sp.]